MLLNKKLNKLAKIATSKAQLAEELSDNPSPRKEALDEYLYTCIELDEIWKLMIEFDLNKDGLEKIYSDLLLLSLGQWINGKYAALATLSDYDALGFYLVARDSGITKPSISETLFAYWQGDISKFEMREFCT